jgi:biopolymer transport protein ExbD
MRRRRPPRGSRLSGDDGVLPLINVVFLLLVFFMLAGRLTSAEMFDIEPTASRSQAEPGDQDLVILIAADGTVAVQDSVLDPDALAAVLSGRASAAPESPLWIKSDAGADALELVAVLDAARMAGLHDVRLLTVRAGS